MNRCADCFRLLRRRCRAWGALERCLPAWLGYVKGDVEEVERVVDESASIARDCGDVRVEARGVAILGTTLAAYTNDMQRTNEVLRQALNLSLPVGELRAAGPPTTA